jgi:hypothetical protein
MLEVFDKNLQQTKMHLFMIFYSDNISDKNLQQTKTHLLMIFYSNNISDATIENTLFKAGDDTFNGYY